MRRNSAITVKAQKQENKKPPYKLDISLLITLVDSSSCRTREEVLITSSGRLDLPSERLD